MSEYKVFQCDRCGRKITQDMLPSGWKRVVLTEEVQVGEVNVKDKICVWCGPCVSEITQRLPEAS